MALGKLATVLLFVTAASLATAEPPAGRLTGTFEGIECEYSPGQEELARLLALRFARHNQEVAAKSSPKTQKEADMVPLSPAEMRAHRADYLNRIAALLALKQPTSLQEECYDAFLDNYEQMINIFERLRDTADGLRFTKQITVWEKKELVRVMEAGNKIKGFAYDPATGSGHTTFGMHLSGKDDGLKDLAAQRDKLRLQYRMDFETKDGVTTYHGGFGPKIKVNPKSQPKPPGTPPPEMSAAFPVILPDDLSGKPAEEQVASLWDGQGDKSLAAFLKIVAGLADRIPEIDPQIALMVLHETIELGIVDRYFRGPDRRWFCDGVANYGAWRVLRDLHGVDLANRTHDLGALLQKYAALREQADLRKWPAAERQSEEEKQTPLNSARYIFAERAVALMDEHGGQDILPHLFVEIGKTKPQKVSIKTVEKAWLKLTGTKLDTILAEAIKPVLPKTE